VVARHYRDLVCWQLADELKRRVYAFTAKGPVSRDVRYCSQIRDSARSAPRNIAEGFGRYRPAEFVRFLEFARGSLAETHNHIADALDLGYVSAEECDACLILANRASAATTKLLHYLRGCTRR
jgi:four helix bundle protein